MRMITAENGKKEAVSKIQGVLQKCRSLKSVTAPGNALLVETLHKTGVAMAHVKLVRAETLMRFRKAGPEFWEEINLLLPKDYPYNTYSAGLDAVLGDTLKMEGERHRMLSLVHQSSAPALAEEFQMGPKLPEWRELLLGQKALNSKSAAFNAYELSNRETTLLYFRMKTELLSFLQTKRIDAVLSELNTLLWTISPKEVMDEDPKAARAFMQANNRDRLEGARYPYGGAAIGIMAALAYVMAMRIPANSPRIILIALASMGAGALLGFAVDKARKFIKNSKKERERFDMINAINSAPAGEFFQGFQDKLSAVTVELEPLVENLSKEVDKVTKECMEGADEWVALVRGNSENNP